MQSRARSTRTIVVLTISLITAACLAVPVTASAAGRADAGIPDGASRVSGYPYAHWQTKSTAEIDGGMVYLPTVNRCAKWTFRASWFVEVGVDTHYKVWAFKNPRVSNPQLTVGIFSSCSYGAASRTSARLTTRTRLSASNFSIPICSWNPSLGVSAPWGISVGVAPTCTNDQRRASRSRVLEPRDPAHAFSIASSGQVGVWNKTEWWHYGTVSGDRDRKGCFKLRVYLDVANAAGTRTEDAISKPVTPNFCLPVGSWAVALGGRG